MRSTRDKEPPGIETLLAAVYPDVPVSEEAVVSPDSDFLNNYQDVLSGMDIEDMIDIMKSGIQRVESADGTPSLMMSPYSSATGLYGQLYSEIKDLPFMQGVSREQFRDDRDLQNRILEMRMRGELPNLPGLYRNARELRDEYAPQFEEKGMYFNYRPDEIAALTNYIGRQGTREYFASLRDGTTFTPPGEVNKSPEEYLERYNEGVLDYMDKTQGDSFKKGGRVVKYKHGGRHWPPEGAEDAFPTSVATRQDSLDAYNAAEQLKSFLNMWEYTTSADTDPGTLYKMAQHLRRARGNYSDAEKREYEDALVNFDAAYKASGRIPTIDDYYGIFNNTTEGDVTRVRELTTGVINPRLGLGYYDTGIEPQGLITGESHIAPVVDPMVHREIMPSYEKETTGQYDIIEFPYYDPIAVKPYDLLTEEEKKQRREKYGPEPWEKEKKEKFKVVKRDPPPKPEPESEPDPAPKPDPTTERKVRVIKEPTGRQPEYLFKAANTGGRGTTRTGQVPYAIKEWDDKRKQWRVRDISEEEIQEYRDKYEIDFVYGGRLMQMLKGGKL